MNTILLGHTYDIEGVGPAVIDEIRSINGEARIKAFPLGVGDVPAVERAGKVELASCPFCGSGAVAHGLWADQRMAVRCMSCDTSGPSTKTVVPEHCIDVRPWINEAIAAWNRRIASPPSPVGADDGLVAAEIRKFASAILHGDDDHRGWLTDAGECFIVGRPLPTPRGKGTSSALASAPQPAKDGWREALEKIAALVSISTRSDDHTRLHAALDTLGEARQLARQALSPTEQAAPAVGVVERLALLIESARGKAAVFADKGQTYREIEAELREASALLGPKEFRNETVRFIAAPSAPVEAIREVPAKNCDIANPSYRDCPNMKEIGGGFEGERYRCDVCGKGYFLDYEDMK